MRFGKRYSHYYNGKRNSRGQRSLSKIHKGLNCGNLERAFAEVEGLNKERKNV